MKAQCAAVIQKRTFALADAPQLQALSESLRATLAGDLAGLRRHYDVALTTRQDRPARLADHASPA